MGAPGNSIRLVLFDVGGVLTELCGLPKLLSWLDHRLKAGQVISFWLASTHVREFETGKIPPEIFAQRIIAELGLPVAPEEFLDELCTRGQRPFPGAAELVQRVPRHYLRATLCNTNVLQWAQLLRQCDLAAVFDHHFASHLTGKIKPDADAFLHVLSTLDVQPHETLFLDDSSLNVIGARKLGITALQVKGLAKAEQALRQSHILPD
jgi:glucose-1-phosphatase